MAPRKSWCPQHVVVWECSDRDTAGIGLVTNHRPKRTLQSDTGRGNPNARGAIFLTRIDDAVGLRGCAASLHASSRVAMLADQPRLLAGKMLLTPVLDPLLGSVGDPYANSYKTCFQSALGRRRTGLLVQLLGIEDTQCHDPRHLPRACVSDTNV